MRYVALKPCSFAGKKFYIGDTIPAELVKNSTKRLIQYGLIAAEAEEKPREETLIEAKGEAAVVEEKAAGAEEKPKRRSRKGDSQ